MFLNNYVFNIIETLFSMPLMLLSNRHGKTNVYYFEIKLPVSLWLLHGLFHLFPRVQLPVAVPDVG